jgi:hypothetical protein
MPTTTKMGIVYPASTDLVKDGATNMGTIATTVDAKTGLVLVKSQTIGTTVSSVTVSDAFSSNFDNYKIIISGGVGSTAQNLLLTLGATVTGYHFSGWYVSSYATATLVADAQQNIGSWTAGFGTTNALSGEIELQSPNLAKRTTVSIKGISTVASSVTFNFQGFLNDATQYTAFTITPNAGTMTGGTISVFGYNK